MAERIPNLFSIVYDELLADSTVLFQPFDQWGARRGSPINVSVGGRPTGSANPVVAALPGDLFAVSWTDGSSGTPDVALRLVNPDVPPSGAPRYAHDGRAGVQQDPDVLWTGSELVVAWSDLFDVYLRRFDSNLTPLDDPRAVSPSPGLAGNVSLAPLGDGWVAAWRANETGLESIAVRVSDSIWNTESYPPVTEGDHPALAELDATHVLLFYASGEGASDAGTSIGRRLRTSIVDVTKQGPLASTPFVPQTPPYDPDFTLRQARPAAVRVGSRVFVGWETESSLGDPMGYETWLAEVAWSPSDPAVLRVVQEWPVPVTVPRLGDQRSPALAASPLFPEGALITVWEDYGALAGGRGPAELTLGFRPTPFVTLADGG